MTIETQFGSASNVKFGFGLWGNKNDKAKKAAAPKITDNFKGLSQDQVDLIKKIQHNPKNQDGLAKFAELFKQDKNKAIKAVIENICYGTNGSDGLQGFKLPKEQAEKFCRALLKIKPEGFITRIINFIMGLIPNFLKKIFFKK